MHDREMKYFRDALSVCKQTFCGDFDRSKTFWNTLYENIYISAPKFKVFATFSDTNYRRNVDFLLPTWMTGCSSMDWSTLYETLGKYQFQYQ